MWVDSHGDPNARACAHLIIGAIEQLNSLADDIAWIKAHLEPRTAAAHGIGPATKVATATSHAVKTFRPIGR